MLNFFFSPKFNDIYELLRFYISLDNYTILSSN